MAKKLCWYIKPHKKEAVQTLIFPRIDENSTVIWITITDKDEIYMSLAERNTRKLIMSNTSPFPTGPLADGICQYSDNNIVDQILYGTIMHATLGITPADVDIQLDKVLKCIHRATASNGSPIHDTNIEITLEE